MAIIRATEAPKFQLPGFTFTGLLSPSRGATEICTWLIEIEPGAHGQAHWLDHEEIFVVLAGTMTGSVNNEAFELHVGDAMSLPAHALFDPSNTDTEPALVMACLPVGAKGTAADGRELGVPPWVK